MAAQLLATALLFASTSATLHVASYDSYDVGGPHPTSTSTVDNLDLSLPVNGSAELTGTLTLGGSPYYAFNCSFGGGQLVFVWLADHLVCHTDPPFPMAGQGHSTDGIPSNPLRGGGRCVEVSAAKVRAAAVAAAAPPRSLPRGRRDPHGVRRRQQRRRRCGRRGRAARAPR